MKDPIHVLIIDDHPMIINAYVTTLNAFSKNNPSFNFVVEKATSIIETVNLFENKTKIDYDLILLDISMPRCEVTKMHSGEDLGLYIKSKLPHVKIIVLTALNDTIRLINIINNLSPNGLLLKKVKWRVKL